MKLMPTPKPSASASANGFHAIKRSSLPATSSPTLDQNEHDLTPEESKRITEAAMTCLINPYTELEEFLLEARVQVDCMPPWLRRLLSYFKAGGNADGVLLIRGFSPDPDLPQTPSESCAGVFKPNHYSEFYMALVGQWLGEMVGYAQEKKGAFWQSLNPSPGHEQRQTSESSAVALSFHTEVMFHPHMPDFVLLYGLRQDPEGKAKTIVSCVRRFYPQLPRRMQELLFQPIFKTGIDPSFGNVKELVGTGPVVSVFYGDREDPYFRYDLDLMVGLSPEASKALEELKERVAESRTEVTIVPGSLCVIDNRRTVHARTAFRAHYDGRDRWLERVSVVKDLTPSEPDRARGSRIIDTDFSGYMHD